MLKDVSEKGHNCHRGRALPPQVLAGPAVQTRGPQMLGYCTQALGFFFFPTFHKPLDVWHIPFGAFQITGLPNDLSLCGWTIRVGFERGCLFFNVLIFTEHFLCARLCIRKGLRALQRGAEQSLS